MWVLRKHFSMLWCWCCQSQLGGWGSRLIWCDLIYSSAAGRNGANTAVRIFHHLPAHLSRDMVISPGAWVFSPGPLLSLSAQNQLLPSPCALLHPCRKLLSGQESSTVQKRRLGEQGPSSSECLLWLSYFLISLLRRYFPFVLNVTGELLAAARLLVGSAAPVKWLWSTGRARPCQARVQQGCAAAALTQITSRILKINQLIKISASALSYMSFPYCKV